VPVVVSIFDCEVRFEALGPNSRTRIMIPNIMEVPWFEKDFKVVRERLQGSPHDDVDNVIALVDGSSTFKTYEASKDNQ